MAVAAPAMFDAGLGHASDRPNTLSTADFTAVYESHVGRVYGFVYSGLDVGLATAPLVFGRLMDRGLFSATLAGVALLQGLGILAAFKVGQQAPKKEAIS